MRHGSLFSGIGGFDLASRWMGWENVFQVEIDPYCQKVLKKNFPNTERYGDIKEFKGERGSVDILTGGFPCQPFSHAGKRGGETDDRYLWPEYLRIIREIRPTYVCGENVSGIISMGGSAPFEELVSTGVASKANLFSEEETVLYNEEQRGILYGIITDLERERYTVESFLIPAAATSAWHRRDRVWIIGYLPERINGNPSCTDSNCIGSHRQKEQQQGKTKLRYEQERGPEGLGEDVSKSKSTTRGILLNTSDSTDRTNGRTQGEEESIQGGYRQAGWAGGVSRTSPHEDVSDSNHERLEGRAQSGDIKGSREERNEHPERCCQSFRGEDGAVESELGNMANGLPPWMVGYWDREPDIPRVSTGEKDRVNKLKGLGNAICPQVAYELFKAIDKL